MYFLYNFSKCKNRLPKKAIISPEYSATRVLVLFSQLKQFFLHQEGSFLGLLSFGKYLTDLNREHHFVVE